MSAISCSAEGEAGQSPQAARVEPDCEDPVRITGRRPWRRVGDGKAFGMVENRDMTPEIQTNFFATGMTLWYRGDQSVGVVKVS
jgi:hypothetical protein